MPIVKVQATKMTGASAQFISLVERGANRIPFKIVKEEKDMAGSFANLDLGSLFRSKKADKGAEVVAVVTMKGENLDSVKKQIADAGFSVADVQELEDGSMVFKQGDVDAEGGLVVRLNDHVALVTKGFHPYSMDMDVAEGTSFADACAAQGFYPGVRTIVDVLATSMQTLVDKAESPAAAATAVSKMFDEAKAYTVAFLRGLPTKAFKLESVSVAQKEDEQAPAAAEGVADAEAAGTSSQESESNAESVEKGTKKKPTAADGKPSADDMADAEGTEGTDPAEGQEDESKSKPKAKAKKDDETVQETAPQGLTAEEVSSIVATQLDGVLTSVTKQVSDALAAALAPITASVESLGTRVEKAEQSAQSAVSALGEVVVHGAGSDDQNPPVKKSESSVFGGREIDTAFLGGVRKRANR